LVRLPRKETVVEREAGSCNLSSSTIRHLREIMALAPGTKVGPYVVASVLGAGGMGEVYRAHDHRLERDVALKLLPDGFVHDPDRVARFRREAQLLAALNHPGIAAIYGVEETDSRPALVLELVEGPTLADRIVHGAIPIDETLPLARQIVDALDAAHSHGITHRDLKPANISVRADGTVKVLDFGLAKLTAPAVQSGAEGMSPAQSPTVTTPALTAIGLILGTAAYMAPEQARGRPVDKRADIWAFGCVVYEMLSGRRAFAGDDVSETMAAILKLEPDWGALPAGTPEPLRRLLRRCLVKDPARRLSDMAVARLEIEDAAAAGEDWTRHVAAEPQPARTRWYRRMGWASAGAAVMLLVLVPFAMPHLREEAPAPSPAIRLAVTAPDGVRIEAGSVVSPDGRFVAFRASRPGENVRLWIRPLDTLEATELSGTDGALFAFWAPDSRAIGFLDGASIKRIDVTGGAAQTIASFAAFSAVWGPDGTVLASTNELARKTSTVWRVPATGGERVAVTTFESDLGVVAQFLPDGRRFLLSASPDNRVLLGSLDSADTSLVLEGAQNVEYAPPGFLLFIRGGTVMAQPFDPDRGLVTGQPVALIPKVSGAFAYGARGNLSVSTNGVLVYREAGAFDMGGTPVWVDRQGRETAVPGLKMEGGVWFPQVSPDGRRLAFVAGGDLWVAELSGRPPVRLTFDGPRAPVFSPLWSRDGQHLVYEIGGEDAGLWSLPSDGRTSAAARVSPPGHFHAHGWSADSRDLVAVLVIGSAGADIVALPYGSESGEARPLVATPAWEGIAGVAVSPDGRWLAYAANSTGRNEIWVRPYPGPGAPVRVSPDGGVEPVWARDGRTLFYREGARLLASEVDPKSVSEFRFQAAELLFEGNYLRGEFLQAPSYDTAPDGRLLMLKSHADPGASPVVVVSNWLAELERVRP
jgi:eukaryotic-like serine/threonine-protein kinase